MIPPPRKKHEEGNVDSWLMSYADMITLLLCFFIIFVSVSEPKQEKLSKAAEGLTATFGAIELNSPFKAALRATEGVIDDNKAYATISADKTSNGIQIELAADTYFQAGTAELSEEQLPVLESLVESLRAGPLGEYGITVQAYTDNTPPEGFASNWEFSALRASRMVRFLAEHRFDPSRLHAEGFGQSHAKVPNFDAQGKAIPENQERNRRIVLKLERAL